MARFLSGQHKEFLDELEESMQAAVAELDFEQASRIKGRIDTINSLESKQHAVSSLNLDSDVIGIYREETIAGISLINVRGGKVINTNEFIFNKGKDVPFEDLVRMFILRYYDKTSSIPHEVILEMLPEDSTVIEEWLTEKLALPLWCQGELHRSQAGRALSALADGEYERTPCAHALQSAEQL